MPLTPRLAILATLGSLSIAPALAADATPNGVWIRDDGNARVRIAPCGSNLCATNIWIGDTSGGEEVGDKLVMTVQPSGKDALKGKAYDPKRGMTYSLNMKVGAASLTTRGCVVGVLCKSVNWTRVGG